MGNHFKPWLSDFCLWLCVSLHLLLGLTGCKKQPITDHPKSFSSVSDSAADREAPRVYPPTITMKTSHVLSLVDQKKYQVAEAGEEYIITAPVVKYYQPTQFLVKSSSEPIQLGAEMLPYMQLDDLRDFMDKYQIARGADTPEEVYLYNWVDKAQGAMIFQTGFVVNRVNINAVSPTTFKLVQLPDLKVCSILYIGPFPYQKNSGWGKIAWERRAAEAGYKYTEVLYRELYHRYDFGGKNQHVTEIEISID